MAFVLDDFLIQVLIAIVLNVIAYVITPQPKRSKPEPAKDAEIPTSDAGRPMPVVFGSMWLQSPNILWSGDKSTRQLRVTI